jgi:DNA-binding CsgD family transcriptional regulator
MREIPRRLDQALFQGKADASARLHEAVRVARRVGGDTGLLNCLDEGSCFCAGQGLWPATVTLRAAYEAHMARAGVIVPPGGDYAELMRRARPGLSDGQARAAAERGARMTADAAAEFITALSVPREAPARRSAELTQRERELVALIAQGHTNAQIAARLFISVRTVTSHIDRIHGKTGYRRRAASPAWP